MSKVTKHEVEHWLGGSGNLSMQECIEIITDVANKNYESGQLYKDIKWSSAPTTINGETEVEEVNDQ